MSYSAKIGDINGFDLDIIAMGSRRRAKAESEKKALVNSKKYTEPTPRELNGGMNTNDNLKAVAAKEIEKMYSAQPVKTRAVPQRTQAKKTAEYAAQHTRRVPTKTVPTVQKVERNDNPQPTSQRVRREKVYTAKRAPTPIQTKKDKNKKPIPVGAVSAILIITVLMLYFIVLYIQSYELEEQISDMKSELSSKMMTQTTWQTKVDEKTPSLDKIEQFAVEDGMVRKTPDKYISITPSDDVIERYVK